MQCTEAGVVIALRRTGRAHAHSSREEGELPEIGIDYGFFGRNKEDDLPILCVECRNSSTGCLEATVVDKKGASDLCEFISDSIHQESGIQSDNERSWLSLIETCDEQLDGCRVGDDDVSRRRSSSRWLCRGRCS